MSKHKDLRELTIESLFTNTDQYTIPIYQRNYSWIKPQIEQLIQDIWDYSTLEKSRNYFIGNLIVYDRLLDNGSVIYETIDGQQRLTTLSILMQVLKKEFSLEQKLNNILHFDSREISTNTLEHIEQISNKRELRKSSNTLNSYMLNAYEYIFKKIDSLSKDKEIIKKFTNYLFEKVVILRISVPEGTDLNHYFEIMNNRGEQLEKHEIVKANLLSFLKVDEYATEEEKERQKKEMQIFNKIWESCKNMEKYIQYAFLPDERKKVFSETWNHLIIGSFDKIVDVYNDEPTKNNVSVVLKDLLEENHSHEKTKNTEEPPERFNSIINFSNFLLHVLRIQVNNNENGIDDKRVPLDDKRLIESFDKEIGYNKGVERKFVKEFIYHLLKAKFKFDHYVIKRELNTEKWSLKQLSTTKDGKAKYVNTFNIESENKNILMQLAMFHVSYPQRLYKHWLNAVLNETMRDDFDINVFKEFLDNLARKFIFDRYLSREETDYHTLIYKNSNYKNKELRFENLDKGTKVENFVFNYLDYILWRDNKDIYSNFDFAFRNSVEHHYPQNPINKADGINEYDLNSFGNLCLLARIKNSKLNNLLPEGKKEHYRNKTIDSIKQKLMFDKYRIFHVEQIKSHREDMITLIKNEHDG